MVGWLSFTFCVGADGLGFLCCAFFCFSMISSTCRQVGRFYPLIFELFHRIFGRRLLDVTSSPSRSLSCSTNESGCSHLGCHRPVMLLQHSTSGMEYKWKSLPRRRSLPKKKRVFGASLATFLRFDTNNGF